MCFISTRNENLCFYFLNVLQVKKEAILNKAKERLTRYEQWKAHGRKGGRKHVLGFGSRTPREVCLPLDSRRSSSQSTLRRSPNSSDYDSYFHRRAVSASSVVRRHCCIDINKLTQGIGMLLSILLLTYNMSVSKLKFFSSTGRRPARYCHGVVSVVRCKLFLQKTSQKLLTGFLRNFTGMFLRWSSFKFLQIIVFFEEFWLPWRSK